MSYWFKANGIPHADTWVFYNKDEALEFARTAELPLVFKPDRGSGATGVRIFRDRKQLRWHIERYFRVGELRPCRPIATDNGEACCSSDTLRQSLNGGSFALGTRSLPIRKVV